MPMIPWGLIFFVISLVASLLQFLLAPKPKKPKPSQLEGAPIASANAPIPVLFGKRWIKQPNVVWWGDVRTKAIKAKGGKK